MKGSILFLVSIFLALILIPLGFLWSVSEAFFKRSFKQGFKRMDSFFMDIAISIDQTGGVMCKELFNDALISHKSKNKFGNPDETISSVLGKNEKEGTLIFLGKALNFVLNLLEPGHTFNSIE
jgi:8-oxo-dGTP diphosphatase